MPRERERSEGTEGIATVYGARRLADRPDLALARDRGQRAEGGLGCGFQLSR